MVGSETPDYFGFRLRTRCGDDPSTGSFGELEISSVNRKRRYHDSIGGCGISGATAEQDRVCAPVQHQALLGGNAVKSR